MVVCLFTASCGSGDVSSASQSAASADRAGSGGKTKRKHSAKTTGSAPSATKTTPTAAMPVAGSPCKKRKTGGGRQAGAAGPGAAGRGGQAERHEKSFSYFNIEKAVKRMKANKVSLVQAHLHTSLSVTVALVVRQTADSNIFTLFLQFI